MEHLNIISQLKLETIIVSANKFWEVNLHIFTKTIAAIMQMSKEYTHCPKETSF